jgi:hypothetical protein
LRVGRSEAFEAATIAVRAESINQSRCTDPLAKRGLVQAVPAMARAIADRLE